MRSRDCTLLVVPGLGSSGPQHWQTRWQANLSTAQRVEQDDWEHPDRESWTARIVEAVNGATLPVVFIAHSLGVTAMVEAVTRFRLGTIAGALLVSCPDVEREDVQAMVGPTFAPVPIHPLPFPSLLVASRTDPYCAYTRAEDFGYAWGSAMVDAGDAGHLNVESGHGPWPEGLMRFAGFLRSL